VLVYDNGRVCVLANTRCGHTSMYSYFGLEPYTVTNSIDHWYNTSSVRVLVLRNPLDRWVSATKHRVNKPAKFTDDEWFVRHGDPYLRDLVWKYYTWSHIDFYKLGDYIPMSPGTAPTHSNYSAGLELRHDPNLRSELVAYRLIRRYSKELSVAEWRELTGVGGSNG
jgi:hypothetical protein